MWHAFLKDSVKKTKKIKDSVKSVEPVDTASGLEEK